MLPLPRLRALRMRRAMTQEDLARVAGVGEATINRIELGRQRAHLSTIRKLAEALSVPPDALMEKTEADDRGAQSPG